MKIKQVILRHLKLDLLEPFTTSFGTEYDRDFILVEAISDDGISGWAESVAMLDPLYNEETLKTNWHILEDYLIPIILKMKSSILMKFPKNISPIFAEIIWQKPL